MVENSPCVDVGVGFLSRVVDEVVGYLGSGDMPSRVLRDGINRRVSNAVTKIMGVMLVKGHRWPTTIGSNTIKDSPRAIQGISIKRDAW